MVLFHFESEEGSFIYICITSKSGFEFLKFLFDRIMVASRDLQPGDIILREKPALTGPNMEQSQPLCLGCYAILNPKKFHPCRKCKAPLCSPECETNPQHKLECEELRNCPMGFYR